jgi:hypothetical protein
MLQGPFLYSKLTNNIYCSSSQNILLIFFGLLVMWGWGGFVFLWVFGFCKHLVPQWVEFFQELGFNSFASYLILPMLMSFFLHL